MNKDLLLEIGVEELPARFVPRALEELQGLAKARLDGKGLTYKSIRTLGTPRRLALIVTELASKGKDLVQESLGPGLAQAKDAEGNWTPAAQGFARSQGTTPEKLETRQTDRGERLCAVKHQEGLHAEKILPELLPELIKKIPFAKNMVWEEGRFSFARPIRWIAALYGSRPVKFQLAGIKSGKKTLGLRFQTKKPIEITSPSRYQPLLKDRCVVVDPAERRALIEKQIQQTGKSVHGHIPMEKFGDLLDEVVHLVEHPVAILGKFDPEYLSLPSEILVTSMKKHQKFFPIFHDAKSGGTLLPNFIGIRNGISENQAVVREGYERVLSARLSDAAFFFGQDRKTRLEEKAPQLKGVLFQKELGTVWDKTARVERLARAIYSQLNNLPAETGEAAGRVAFLAKADLVTAVVGEFPELQGVMGRLYALADGEPSRVADGIEQHYWPLTADGELPKSEAGALVSLADKLDTLAGDFLVGLIPTGSADPYGLRRAAIGILRILSDRQWRLDLRALAEQAVLAFPETVKGDRAKTVQTLADFFKQRWSALMEAKGYRFDEIEAVASVRFGDAVDAEQRLKALHDIRRHPDFAPLSIAFKRAANILSQARKKDWFAAHESKGSSVQGDRLAEPAEKELFSAYENIARTAAPHLESFNYDDALKELVKFKAPVDEFFIKVMVMAPEQELAANRLTLLKSVETLFRRVADFSLLQDVPSGSIPDGINN